MEGSIDMTIVFAGNCLLRGDMLLVLSSRINIMAARTCNQSLLSRRTLVLEYHQVHTNIQ